MDIAGAGAVSSAPITMTGASRMGGGGSEGRMGAAITSAASLFGMSASDLTQQLDAGKSMASIADSKGIAQSDLIDAIKKGIQQSTPQGAPGPSGALLDKIATRIATHAGGQVSGHAHRHHHGGGTGAPPTVVRQPAPYSTVTTWL